MSDSKFLRGTLILTVGTFFIKFLGMMYVVPFQPLVGPSGLALYQYGYAQYVIFLSVATAGVPLAVSKFVSKYNELGQYKTSRKMLTSGILLLTITGLVAFLVLYFLAPTIAKQAVVEDKNGNTVGDIIMVIRMVSIALLIVPIQSIIRGYFQGHQSMGPTTISQLVEQIVRISFLLGASFFVLNVLGGTVPQAVGWATFAAFVGAIGGLAVLLWHWYKQRGYLRELAEKDTSGVTLSTVSMYKELITYAIPFVFVSMAIPLFQQIDVLTFNRAMVEAGHGDIAEASFGILNVSVRQLGNIPVTLATAFSLTLVPAITKLYVSNNQKGLQHQISQVFQIILFLTIPASIGMSILGYPLYTAFFGPADSEIGGLLLTWAAPSSIFLSLFSISAAILQGINKQKHAIVGSLLGVFIKWLLNEPLILAFAAIGSILSTIIGFSAAILYFVWQIKRNTNVHFQFVIRRTMLVIIFTAIMAAVVKGTAAVLSLTLSYEAGRGQAIMILIPSVLIGMGVYFFLTAKSGLLRRVLGATLLDSLKRKVLRRG